MTRDIELSFVAAAPHESISERIARFGPLVDSEGKRLDTRRRNELESRVLFWQSRIEARRGNETVRKTLLDSALGIAGHATAEYISHRVVWLDENPGDYSKTEWYRHLIDEYGYFEKRCDYIMLYCRARELMDLMRDIGFMSRAEHYLSLADRWTGEQSKWIELSDWSLNKAALYYDLGKKKEAMDIMKGIARDSVAMRNPETLMLVNYNMFIMGGDTLALRKAYGQIGITGDRLGLLPMVSAFLSENALARGDYVLASKLADEALGNFQKVSKDDMRLVVLRRVAEVRYATSDSESALKAYRMYADCAAEIARVQMVGEVAWLETQTGIREIDAEIESKLRRKRISLIIILTVACLCVLGAGFVFRRRYKRLSALKSEAERRAREAEREQLAMRLDSDSRNKALEEAVGKLNAMHSEGGIPEESHRKISKILVYGSNRDAEKVGFAELFRRINPAFIERLRSEGPCIGESGLRVASYIAIGMTSKEIANEMGVRPESVRQTRWRIRKALSLPAGTDVDAYIRELYKKCSQ